MQSFLSRSSGFSSYLKASSRVTGSPLKEGIPTVTGTKFNFPVPPTAEKHTQYSLWKDALTGPVQASSGVGASNQIRYAHSDVKIPDFTHYRRDSTKDPTKKSSFEEKDSRQGFTYLIVATGGTAAVYCAKNIVTMFVSTMSPSADVLAMGKIEIELAKIPEGKNVTFKWRGKPLFVRHRTAEEIQIERNVDLSILRDPETDAQRAQIPEWLVVIGVCTHLGCVPIANAGDYGGYYCPCHGSHYDAAGRIRKGPAPINLELPEYEFPEPGLLVVG